MFDFFVFIVVVAAAEGAPPTQGPAPLSGGAGRWQTTARLRAPPSWPRQTTPPVPAKSASELHM